MFCNIKKKCNNKKYFSRHSLSQLFITEPVVYFLINYQPHNHPKQTQKLFIPSNYCQNINKHYPTTIRQPKNQYFSSCQMWGETICVFVLETFKTEREFNCFNHSLSEYQPITVSSHHISHTFNYICSWNTRWKNSFLMHDVIFNRKFIHCDGIREKCEVLWKIIKVSTLRRREKCQKDLK